MADLSLRFILSLSLALLATGPLAETGPALAASPGDASGRGADSDADGLPNATEISIGSDPTDADTDDDGVLDGAEPGAAVDSDGDGLVGALDPDSDDDGLYDGQEMGNACSGPATDLTAQSCESDADLGATTTDPLDSDTDNGGVSDGSEDTNHNGQIDPGEVDPNNAADDSVVTDTDGDGLSDNLEAAIGTSPNDGDSDDDGLLDGDESNPRLNQDGDCTTNVLDPDSDNDGIPDGTEKGQGCSHPATDVSRGLCMADADGGATVTSVLLADSDGGGAPDGQEDENGDGKIDAGETDPVNFSDDEYNAAVSGCPDAPVSGCRAAGSASLSISKSADNTKESFSWKWSKGVDALVQDDFGDPVSSPTVYRVCVYDRTASLPSVRMEATLSSGYDCVDPSPWKAASTKGWSFKNKSGNADGLGSAKFKAGSAGKPSIGLKGKSLNLPLPPAFSGSEYFDQDTEVVLQFYSSSPADCWTSTFEAAGTSKNSATSFKAKGN